MKTKKILVVGPSDPGALTKSFIRGFTAAGCETRHFEPRRSGRLQGLVLTRIPLPAARRRVWGGWEQELLAEALNFHPDLVVVMKGSWLSPVGLSALRAKTGAALANYFPDDPFHHPGLGEYVLKSAAVYDRFFVFAHAFVPRLIGLGVRARFLPFAWDPEMHPATHSDLLPLCDISFVGNWDPVREAWLDQIADLNLGLWGHWEKLPLCSALRDRVCGPPQVENAMAETISRSKISLNLIRIVANGHNMRSYEVPGVGAFLLSTRSPELSALFEEDSEISCFSTPAELRDKARYYLAHPLEREHVAAAGHRRVLGETYVARARAILDEVFRSG